MKRSILFLSILLLSAYSSAQGEYERKVFISSTGDSLNYRLLRPEAVDAGKKYPLVLFLHGAGERGDDNEKQLTHGSRMFQNPVNREKYPTFVLCPQCPVSGYWGYPSRPTSFQPSEMPGSPEQTPIFRDVKELLDMYLAMPEVDKSRIYIIGLSMGGMGTYDFVSRFPDLFAAAIPICGTINPDRLKKVKKTSFRIFHGDSDDVVPVEGSREAYKALKASGVSVEYIEFPGCNHGSWNPAFNYPGFMDWLFQQKKK